MNMFFKQHWVLDDAMDFISLILSTLCMYACNHSSLYLSIYPIVFKAAILRKVNEEGT